MACPNIHYHISSGNAEFVLDQLDKGLIDFGMISGSVDHAKYNSIQLPYKDIWGVLMRKDSPLAVKETITPEDLRDKPLIISRQDDSIGALTAWIKREISEIEIIATYNLLFNASLMVEEGMSIIWKKYQVFSKASEKFIQEIRELTKIN